MSKVQEEVLHFSISNRSSKSFPFSPFLCSRVQPYPRHPVAWTHVPLSSAKKDFRKRSFRGSKIENDWGHLCDPNLELGSCGSGTIWLGYSDGNLSVLDDMTGVLLSTPILAPAPRITTLLTFTDPSSENSVVCGFICGLDSVDVECEMKVWNVHQKLVCAFPIPKHTAYITCAIQTGPSLVWSADCKGVINQWRYKFQSRTTPVFKWTGTFSVESGVYAMTFASSQNEVWIGLQSTVLCVSVDQMEVIARVPMRVGVAGKAIPSSLSYIQQTQQIWCSVCTEPSIMVWDVPSRSCISIIRYTSEMGRNLTKVEKRKTLKRAISRKQKTATIPFISCATVTPDESLIIFGGLDGSYTCFETQTGAFVQSEKKTGLDFVSCIIAFSGPSEQLGHILWMVDLGSRISMWSSPEFCLSSCLLGREMDDSWTIFSQKRRPLSMEERIDLSLNQKEKNERMKVKKRDSTVEVEASGKSDEGHWHLDTHHSDFSDFVFICRDEKKKNFSGKIPFSGKFTFSVNLADAGPGLGYLLIDFLVYARDGLVLLQASRKIWWAAGGSFYLSEFVVHEEDEAEWALTIKGYGQILWPKILVDIKPFSGRGSGISGALAMMIGGKSERKATIGGARSEYYPPKFSSIGRKLSSTGKLAAFPSLELPDSSLSLDGLDSEFPGETKARSRSSAGKNIEREVASFSHVSNFGSGSFSESLKTSGSPKDRCKSEKEIDSGALVALRKMSTPRGFFGKQERSSSPNLLDVKRQPNSPRLPASARPSHIRKKSLSGPISPQQKSISSPGITPILISDAPAQLKPINLPKRANSPINHGNKSPNVTPAASGWNSVLHDIKSISRKSRKPNTGRRTTILMTGRETRRANDPPRSRSGTQSSKVLRGGYRGIKSVTQLSHLPPSEKCPLCFLVLEDVLQLWMSLDNGQIEVTNTHTFEKITSLDVGQKASQLLSCGNWRIESAEGGRIIYCSPFASVAAVFESGWLILWAVDDFSRKFSKKVIHKGSIAGSVYIEADERFCFGEKKGEISLWGIEKSMFQKLKETRIDDTIRCMIVIGAVVWVGGDSGKIFRFHSSNLEVISWFQAHDCVSVEALVSLPFPNSVWSLSPTDSKMYVWCADTCRLLVSPISTSSPCISIAKSQDGRIVIVGGIEEELQFWDAWSFQCVGSLEKVHGESVQCLALGSPFVSRGTYCVNFWSGGRDGSLAVWEIASINIQEEQKTTLNFAELKNWKKISATPYSAGSFPLTSVRAPSSSAAGSSPSFHTASTFQAPSSFGHEKEKEKVKRKHMLMRGGGYERRVKTEESDKKILSLFGCGIDDILQQELWVSQKFLDGPLVPSSLVILCQTILNVCDDAQEISLDGGKPLEIEFIMKQIKSRETEGLSKMSIQSLLIVLKKFFSEMPQKLVSYQVVSRIGNLEKISKNSSMWRSKARAILKTLPSAHYALLHYFLKFLSNLVALKSTSSKKLSTIFGPLLLEKPVGGQKLQFLMLSQMVLERLITRYGQLFDDQPFPVSVISVNGKKL